MVYAFLRDRLCFHIHIYLGRECGGQQAKQEVFGGYFWLCTRGSLVAVFTIRGPRDLTMVELG